MHRVFIFMFVGLFSIVYASVNNQQTIKNENSNFLKDPLKNIPKHCVHFAPEGSVVEEMKDGSFVINHPNGKQIKSNSDCRKVMPTIFNAMSRSTAAYAATKSETGRVTQFSGQWTIPTTPKEYDHIESVLTLNVLSDWYRNQRGYDLLTYLRASLQFGKTDAGGGAYWAIVSTYVNGEGVVYGAVKQVAFDEQILGNITFAPHTNEWTVETVGMRTGGKSTLTVKPTNKMVYYSMNGLQLGGRDEYGCDEEPKGESVFSKLVAKDGNVNLKPLWLPTVFDGFVDGTTCIDIVTVDDSKGTVTFTYSDD